MVNDCQAGTLKMEQLDPDITMSSVSNMPQPVQVMILENASPFNKIKMIASGSSALRTYVSLYNPWERWILDEFTYGNFSVDKDWINTLKLSMKLIDGRRLFIAILAAYRASTIDGITTVTMRYPGMRSLFFLRVGPWRSIDTTHNLRFSLEWVHAYHESNAIPKKIFEMCTAKINQYRDSLHTIPFNLAFPARYASG